MGRAQPGIPLGAYGGMPKRLPNGVAGPGCGPKYCAGDTFQGSGARFAWKLMPRQDK